MWASPDKSFALHVACDAGEEVGGLGEDLLENIQGEKRAGVRVHLLADIP